MPSLSDFKDIIAIAAALIGASVAIFNWRAARFRGKLKDDLDIQKRYREELQAQGKSSSEVIRDEHYAALQTKIHRKMNRAYILKGTDWSDAAISLVLFSVATLAWNNDSLLASGWRVPVITGLSVVAAVYAFLAIHDRGRTRD